MSDSVNDNEERDTFLLTEKEAAARLGWSTPTLAKLRQTGVVRALQVGESRPRYVWIELKKDILRLYDGELSK